jgi:Xaa-Pro aminopeptidase
MAADRSPEVSDLRGRYPEVKIRDASPILLAMGEIKGDVQLALIQGAVDIAVEARKAAMARVLTATHATSPDITRTYPPTARFRASSARSATSRPRRTTKRCR